MNVATCISDKSCKTQRHIYMTANLHLKSMSSLSWYGRKLANKSAVQRLGSTRKVDTWTVNKEKVNSIEIYLVGQAKG